MKRTYAKFGSGIYIQICKCKNVGNTIKYNWEKIKNEKTHNINRRMFIEKIKENYFFSKSCSLIGSGSGRNFPILTAVNGTSITKNL